MKEWFTVFLVLCLSGCVRSRETVLEEYNSKVMLDLVAYAGSNAQHAFDVKMRHIEYMMNLQSSGFDLSPVDYDDIYAWQFARLGLLAEHLGKEEDSKSYFSVALRHIRIAQPTLPDLHSEAGLRTGRAKGVKRKR